MSCPNHKRGIKGRSITSMRMSMRMSMSMSMSMSTNGEQSQFVRRACGRCRMDIYPSLPGDGQRYVTRRVLEWDYLKLEFGSYS